MAVVFYKFKSSKDFLTLPIDAPFISVSDFKTQIFASKRYGHGRDFDLLVSDAQTHQDYADDSILIRENSSVLIRRIPGLPPLPIVVGGDHKPNPEINPISSQAQEEDFDSHDFGADFSPSPKTLPSIRNPSNTHCKEGKVERGFTVSYPIKRSAPPQGYVCRRCKVAGHYIQHCPTNGDPSYDMVVQRVKPTTSASASASVSSCVTNSNSVADDNTMILPELCCPLCKKLMRDASLTKCCFNSFCLNCIRDYIASNSACVCQMKILADDNNIVPNKTVRDTISRILSQGGGDRSSSSGNNGGSSSSVVQVQDFALSIAASKPAHYSEQVKGVPTANEHENKRKRKADICLMIPAQYCFPNGYGGYVQLQHNHIHGFSSERDLSQFGQPTKKYKV